jgi:anaerobic selenocysteine-containing dehydrogenase
MNPQDAQTAGLSENDTVRLTSPHGTVLLPLKLDSRMQPGYLFAPIHYNEPNFNSLMSAVPIDPKARMPALKVVPVKVAPVDRGYTEVGSRTRRRPLRRDYAAAKDAEVGKK